MSLSLWLEINAFIALFFGSMLTFWPRQLTMMPKLDEKAELFARSLGGAVLSFALINWGSHNFTGYDVIWWIVGANILMQAVTGIMDLKIYRGTPSGKFSAAFHFLFAAVFAYYFIFTR